MKPNSLVVYVGGQCELGKAIYPLSKSKVYTVKDIYLIDYPKCGLHTYITLEEIDNYDFLATMFKEVDPPREINLEEILTVQQES